MLMTAEYIEKTGGTGRLPGKREEDTMELLTALGTGEGAFKPFERLIRYNEHAAGAELTCRNAVEIFTDGRGLYEDLAGAIANAGEYIHILSYIIRRDEVFEALEEMLEQKVRKGVKVRILADVLGSRALRPSDIIRLRRKGIQVNGFFSSFPGSLRSRINCRNHRKVIVIDGRIGYVGGFNIGREYLGLDRRMGYWRDTHLKLQGSAVASLNHLFLADWKAAARENLPDAKQDLLPGEKACADRVPVQIVSSGPDSRWQNIRNNYLMLFQTARKRLYIQTPYFIPDETMVQELRMAALSGVDVRLMIPCKPDHPLVYRATCSYIGDMLEAGVKCYRYDRGFLHAKSVVADGLAVCCGTANMDIRSFRLNYEVNATIYDPATAGKMEEIFLRDLKSCTEITKEGYGKRRSCLRMKEQVSRLFSPFL